MGTHKRRNKDKGDLIKEYWENQAKIYKKDHRASWGDKFMIDLEIETIGKYLSRKDKVLDAGCANGYSTIEQLGKNRLKSIVGIDFSANMVKQANSARKKLVLQDDNIRFEVGDIRDIGFPNNTFDKVYTTRTIINLPTWHDQKRAVNECLRVTKKGGKIILSEAFKEPLVLLNSLRKLKKLPPLVEPDFNRYIKKPLLERYLTSNKLKFTVVDFSSIYYLGSRFLRELVLDNSKNTGYFTPINKIFYKIEKEFSGGGFGIQQAYVINK